jgi:hypothetical protein
MWRLSIWQRSTIGWVFVQSSKQNAGLYGRGES